MKKLKFYPNHPDGMHCGQAVFRSLFHYFFDQDLSWEEIDTIAKTIPNKGSWTLSAEIELAKRGVEVVNIEPFDYALFQRDGVKYLENSFDEKTTQWYLKKSNLLSVRDNISEFLKLIKHETRRATIQDIDAMLAKGYLIGAEINSRVLNSQPGFSLHYVLIRAGDQRSYIINDPGGGSAPPTENRKVSKKELINALGSEGANGEVTGFRKLYDVSN